MFMGWISADLKTSKPDFLSLKKQRFPFGSKGNYLLEVRESFEVWDSAFHLGFQLGLQIWVPKQLNLNEFIKNPILQDHKNKSNEHANLFDANVRLHLANKLPASTFSFFFLENFRLQWQYSFYEYKTTKWFIMVQKHSLCLTGRGESSIEPLRFTRRMSSARFH